MSEIYLLNLNKILYHLFLSSPGRKIPADLLKIKKDFLLPINILRLLMFCGCTANYQVAEQHAGLVKINLLSNFLQEVP